ncbi:dentin matrix acidic phosphoprotein 1 [Hordeum vulgare]|nr:dentin matrix acidic phosphoprotein 1 [Hordeum vulgare]
MNTKRGRSRSPVEVKDDHSKGSGSYARKENVRDLQNDTHARPGRGHEFDRHSDRHSYGASRESRRHDDYRRYHDKRADDDRSHPRTSRSDRESRADTYYDPSKRDGTSDRSHGDWRNADSRYGGKSVKREQRSKNQEKHESPHEYPRHDVPEYDKDADLGKETHSSRRYPEEGESKNKEKFKQHEVLKKRSGKEIEKSSCAAEPELETREKRRSLFSSVGPDVENEQHREMDTSGGIKDEAMNDLNAAKVAAMKAAELVNKNIVGFGVGTGRLSTDQKKKLLWGNKKSNPPETSTHWDSNLFSDRERQEKFNKLMGVKSSASASVQESMAGNKEEGPAEVKKQEELDTDLEKLYVAGLRRRDGRTVGLGL